MTMPSGGENGDDCFDAVVYYIWLVLATDFADYGRAIANFVIATGINPAADNEKPPPRLNGKRLRLLFRVSRGF